MHGLFIRKTEKVLQLLQKNFNEPEHTPHKIWVDKNIEFYNKSKKS